MKKLILITFLTFLMSNFSWAQSGPDDLIKTFFSDYPKNSNKAVDDLYATNIWTQRIKDGIENMKKEINGYTADYVGKYYGFELITKKHISESFVLYSYMVRYDRQPMRFTFEFYKPNDKWSLYSFKIDSNLDDELEQSAKLYYIDLEKK